MYSKYPVNLLIIFIVPFLKYQIEYFTQNRIIDLKYLHRNAVKIFYNINLILNGMQ